MGEWQGDPWVTLNRCIDAETGRTPAQNQRNPNTQTRCVSFASSGAPPEHTVFRNINVAPGTPASMGLCSERTVPECGEGAMRQHAPSA